MMSAHTFRRSKVREREGCMYNSSGLVLRTMTAYEPILSIRLATAEKMSTVTRIGPGACDLKDGDAA